MGRLSNNYYTDLKCRAERAAAKQDAEMALEVCKEIGAAEVFVGQSPNVLTPAGDPIKLKIKYPSVCQACGMAIPLDTEVLWQRNRGCWHMECI